MAGIEKYDVLAALYSNRDNALLTESHRNFIQNPDDFAHASSGTKRQRIRDRARHGILDLALLSELEANDRELILKNIESPQQRERVVSWALESLFLLATESNVDFEAALETALEWAYEGRWENHVVEDVNVTIDVRRRKIADPDDVLATIQAGNSAHPLDVLTASAELISEVESSDEKYPEDSLQKLARIVSGNTDGNEWDPLRRAARDRTATRPVHSNDEDEE